MMMSQSFEDHVGTKDDHDKKRLCTHRTLISTTSSTGPTKQLDVIGHLGNDRPNQQSRVNLCDYSRKTQRVVSPYFCSAGV